MSSPTTISDDIFTDSRDGEVYGTKRIGDQVWMTENLRYNGPASYSVDDNAANDATYGRLYEWPNVPENIPDGWHLASDNEWKTLEKQLGMSAEHLIISNYSTPRGTDQGTQLKEGGSSGLNFPLASYRADGSFHASGNKTYLWNLTDAGGGHIYRRRLVVSDPSCYRFTNPFGSFAISVRLVKD